MLHRFRALKISKDIKITSLVLYEVRDWFKVWSLIECWFTMKTFFNAHKPNYWYLHWIRSLPHIKRAKYGDSVFVGHILRRHKLHLSPHMVWQYQAGSWLRAGPSACYQPRQQHDKTPPSHSSHVGRNQGPDRLCNLRPTVKSKVLTSFWGLSRYR